MQLYVFLNILVGECPSFLVLFAKLYHMARNIGMELTSAVEKVNCVPSNFIPPTFNVCVENSRCLCSLECATFLSRTCPLVQVLRFITSAYIARFRC